jgi:hypothetical protein
MKTLAPEFSKTPLKTTKSGRYSLNLRGFDPAKLDILSVIRIPIDFRDGDGPQPKRFLVLGHSRDACLCLKTTSKHLGKYRADAPASSDAILVAAGECECFEVETAIQLTNGFAIRYANLTSYAKTGELEILGVFNGGGTDRLRDAITACGTLVERTKEQMLAVLAGKRL